ncbi:winged helix-turn-helix transcriptional regulator [Streptomyces sp. NPDC050549]|uniref:winged helix-turn-helix transcriptional regulator n=1 Tax=Streptomyces sp. NPDC050549 TaxID=3155406 RepID=UPI00342B90F7
MALVALEALEGGRTMIRTVYPTVPPRVEYRLTELGQEVGGLVQSITVWAQANGTAMRAAREEFDGRDEQRGP